MTKKKVLIMGAAGRDFHNFNVYYRDNADYEVVAFTAFQIPNIAGRKYPAVLAGKLYPAGIPIYEEKEMPALIKKLKVDEVEFAYSDVSFDTVMAKASLVISCGADFKLLSGEHTFIKSKKPVVAVCAARTGCGKSQTTRMIAALLKEMGKKVVAIRHPMPYGDLSEQIWQRFATLKDLEKHKCTIEEMEEYEPHIAAGHIVYAGVDYGKILEEAEKEADVILWDGGNNDLPFYKPDMHIVVTDPLRPGHEEMYHPGAANVRMADVVVINKVDTAKPDDVEEVKKNVRRMNPKAAIIEAESPVCIENENGQVKNKKVLVVEDGPTLTHGGMAYGAGYVAARQYGAGEIVDPRPFGIGTIKKVFENFPHLKEILPAMGYGKEQMEELKKSIDAIPADLVIVGTPIDLATHLHFNKPSLRVTYSLKERTVPGLKEALKAMFKKA
ncbi:MAG: GTPase [Elusimicrobia bacterium GWC2_51_8]|nr:MAG: GTPase [Elusimicrobia bacterium GWA2_51_34]OGR60769.1 MAG: GTPase [Elusimicrobia bacterium GWC2_51_8]OGR88332.1 MAG: GTPase [Elusimicrobia bacterium GWF2_52_66]HAF96585.1 GTPase [Elusimicrobiota bacterium]HCE98189.1 GTPase [Elusimicrobiota bacterium]